MQNNSRNFSMEDMIRIAQSPTGRQLISLLKQQNPSELEKISQLASLGNITQAKDILQRMLNTDEGKKLTQKLEDDNG